jgi:FtsP/CotA-like multicopper oxidase with cupredoxin domain
MRIGLYFLMTLCLFFHSYIRSDETVLRVTEKKILVQGKEASVFAITQSDGTFGLYVNKGQAFDVRLENHLQVPTSVHWHGLVLPNNQDGVAFITQFPIYPGLAYVYKFPLIQEGSFWMHSHVNLQEQKLLSAPLILYGPEDLTIADKEAVVLLTDFTFKSPMTIFQGLKCNQKQTMSSNKMIMQDIVEVDYDAFLANYHTLDHPEIIEVAPGSRVRLRMINGSSATNFFLHLGALEGEAIAVDGNRIQALRGTEFELSIAQRIDILVTIPLQGGSFPILAQGEGTNLQTGVILITKGSKVPSLSPKTAQKAGTLTNAQESKLHAMTPLSERSIDKKLTVELGGNMQEYIWTLNGQSWPEVTPLVVEKGQRVEIAFVNTSTMSHPMHLHGHVFQVTAINGKPLNGAMRDTVLVMPKSSLSIQFDADNPGVWPLHCHVLYHLEAGMLTVLRYKDFIQPLGL